MQPIVKFITPVLLNGWKQIADYLRSGVRTVQRSEQLGLPVMRLRPGDRGPVIAYSETLDSWIKSRATGNKQPLPPDIAATLQHAKFIRQRMMDQLRVLVKNELAAGKILAKLAKRPDNPKVLSRETALARQAYDTIMNLSQRVTVTGVQTKGFAAELDQLRAALRKLGEKL